MTKKIICIAHLIVLSAICAFGQNQASPMTSATPGLETILSEAAKQTQNYREEFKNLLADEKKTFESYNKNGEMKKQTVVESNFLVYQSSKVSNINSELRNVVKVDAKPVPDSQKRSDLFFAELEKASTVESELEKIQKESSRYDKTLEITRLTLDEGVSLSENLRPFFDFRFVSQENYQGADVYLITNQQTKKSPFIALNEPAAAASEGQRLEFKFNLPGALKGANALLRGKLWIDAKTFQIWREERELTVQGVEPLVILKTTFEYQASDYGILVPKQILLTSNNIRKSSEANQFVAVKDMSVIFDYSRFRKTNVDIKILDDQ
jgi:hypothetical protein